MSILLRWRFLPLALLLLSPPALASQDPPSDAEERYEVFLITADQGDAVWELFGHNALLIRDLRSGEALVWNWGLFNFADVDFIPRFLRGTMRYAMGPADPAAFLGSYAAANRTLYANQLFLTDAEAAELDRFVRWNFQEENRPYVYHYFLDNCSTRLRDALDGVLGGALGEYFRERPTAWSFRADARRLVQETLWIDQGLSFLLGSRGDRKQSEWERMYIPMELMTLLEGFERLDPESGTSVPLLGPREVLFAADRPATPSSPPPFQLRWLLLGGGMALLLALSSQGRPAPGRGVTAFGSRGSGSVGAGFSGRRWRWVFLSLVALWGGLSGILGGILTFALFTDHDFIHWNLNLAYLNPLTLLLPLLLLGGYLEERRASDRGGAGSSAPQGGAPRGERWAARLALTIASLSLLTFLLQLTPLLRQENAEVVAVALPIHLSLAFLLRGALAGGETSAPGRP